MLFIDARLPVRFGPLDARAPGEAVVTDSALPVAGPVARFAVGVAEHPADCACCTPRSAAATALAALFRERALGGPLFRGVLAVVSAEGERAVRTALAEDAVVSARFRSSV